MIYALTAALVSFGGVVQAQDKFRPLSEVLTQEQSSTMTNYILKRCAALTMEMAFRTERSETRDGSQELMDFMKTSYEKLTSLSIDMTNVMNGREGTAKNQTVSEVITEVLGIQQQFSTDMDATYMLTGNSLSPQTQEDLAICVEISKSV
jgi:hypothetical protein